MPVIDVSAQKTVFDIIKASLRKIGVLAHSEEPTADQVEDGLDALRGMLDSWSAEHYTVPNVTRESFSLVSGQSSYGFGPAGDFDSERPIEIVAATIRQDGIDYPLGIQNLERFNNVTAKEIQSRPCFLYYTREYPQSRVYFDYRPDIPYEIIIDSLKPFTAPASKDSIIDLRPGYERAIIFNLAIELSPEYGIEPPTSVVFIAARAKKSIRLNGGHIPTMDANVHGSSGRYDIRTGE